MKNRETGIGARALVEDAGPPVNLLAINLEPEVLAHGFARPILPQAVIEPLPAQLLVVIEQIKRSSLEVESVHRFQVLLDLADGPTLEFAIVIIDFDNWVMVIGLEILNQCRLERGIVLFNLLYVDFDGVFRPLAQFFGLDDPPVSDPARGRFHTHPVAAPSGRICWRMRYLQRMFQV